MDPFLEQLAASRKAAKKLVVAAGDPGPQPITKIGGTPWWPRGVAQPRCPIGHLMTFFFQVHLADLPASPAGENGLVSFHYCQSCAYEGASTYGYHDLRFQLQDRPLGHKGYDVRVFQDVQGVEPADELVQGVGPVPGATIAFGDAREEVMSEADYTGHGVAPDGPHPPEVVPHDPYKWPVVDRPEYPYDFDSEGRRTIGWPEWATEDGAKLGGWPSWYNYPDWLVCPHGRLYWFLGQIDFEAIAEGPWGGGGRGFFWVCPPDCAERAGEFLCQI